MSTTPTTDKPAIGSDMGTMEILRDLYLRDKVEEDDAGGSVDLAVLTYLLVKKAHDHSIFDAKGTIAQRLLISIDTLARSLKRLERAGYIITKARGNSPAAIFVDVDRIRARQGARSEPTKEAIRLAQDHTDLLVANANETNKPRNKKTFQSLSFMKQQRHSAQRFIDLAGGDSDCARDLFVFAMDEPAFQKIFNTQSLYKLNSRFKDIKAEFGARYATPGPTS